MIAAIVPAAGRSIRMGRPKLTLPFGGVALITRVIAALRGGGADRVVVVAPPIREPGAAELIAEAERAGADVAILSTPTADMRASVAFGLDRIERSRVLPDAVLIAPGDSPGITPKLVAAVIARFRGERPSIVVPTHEGRGGHPLLIAWEPALAIRGLPPGVGINALVTARSETVVKFEVDDPGITKDLDTPEDYRRWTRA